MTTHPEPFGFDAEMTPDLRYDIREQFAALPGARTRVSVGDALEGGMAAQWSPVAVVKMDGIRRYVNLHPVFPLAEHYRAEDRGNPGVSQNPYRGDHLTIPCWSEQGLPALLEVSFHKGSPYVDVVTFERSAQACALNEALEAEETR